MFARDEEKATSHLVVPIGLVSAANWNSGMVADTALETANPPHTQSVDLLDYR
jgi:hypothetical protein